MNNNLLIILSDIPINYSSYIDYDIINVNKETFGKNEDDLLWSINALNYSNFLKNELEFERPHGYKKVILQKINDINNINRSLINFKEKLYDYSIYTNDYNHNKSIDTINPFNWISNSLTFNIASSITKQIYYKLYLSGDSYWNKIPFLKNNFGLCFYSHCSTHNLRFQCIK